MLLTDVMSLYGFIFVDENSLCLCSECLGSVSWYTGLSFVFLLDLLMLTNFS